MPETVNVSELFLVTDWLEASVDQLEPPFVEYWTWKYALSFALFEFDKIMDTGADEPEQLPRDVETDVSIIGHSIVELALSVV